MQSHPPPRCRALQQRNRALCNFCCYRLVLQPQIPDPVWPEFTLFPRSIDWHKFNWYLNPSMFSNWSIHIIQHTTYNAYHDTCAVKELPMHNVVIIMHMNTSRTLQLCSSSTFSAWIRSLSLSSLRPSWHSNSTDISRSAASSCTSCGFLDISTPHICNPYSVHGKLTLL